MNERIRELAEQLGYNVDFEPSDDETDRSYQVISNDFAEKFAELIVKECVEICDAKRAEYTKLSKDADNFTDKNLWAEGEISAHRIRILIQEHFGVKE